MNNVPPPAPPPQPPYFPPGPPGQYPPGAYPNDPGQPPPPKSGGTGKCFLIGCVVLPILFIVGCVGIAVFVFSALKSSDPYKEALARARANPQVAAALGSPIDEPFLVMGSISFKNSDADADLHTTLTGPKGKGDLTVRGTKSDGVWSYSDMHVRIKGTDESIDLLDGSR